MFSLSVFYASITFSHFSIFFYGFGGTLRGLNTGAEVLPADVCVFPLFIHSAVAVCYLHRDSTSSKSLLKYLTGCLRFFAFSISILIPLEITSPKTQTS